MLRIYILLIISISAVFPQTHIFYTSNISGAITGCDCPGNRYGGLDRIAGVFAKLRSEYPNAIFVDAGDAFNTYPSRENDEIVATIMDMAGYDVLLPGDQDLQYGLGHFWQRQNNAPERWLTGNLPTKNGAPVRHILLKRKDQTILFLGWHGNGIFAEVSELNRYYITPDGLSEYIVELKRQLNPDITVLLAHGKYDNWAKFNSATFPADVIIAGHSQEIVDFMEGKTFEAGFDGQFVGHITLEYKNGQLSIGHKLIEIVKETPVPNDIRTLLETNGITTPTYGK
jgi:2',3'-cyclic-nucleotide 2'-phosphodiesterase (5'-nucleotidase family)